MGTTSLFVELLVIGLQGGAWLALVVLSVCERASGGSQEQGEAPGVAFLSSPIFWAVVAGLCYVLGIALDRVIHSLVFKCQEDWVRSDAARRVGTEVDRTTVRGVWERARIATLTANGKLPEYFGYFRHRVRVMRASTVNLLLIGIACALFAHKCSLLPVMPPCSWLLLGGVLACVCWCAWWRLEHTCSRLIFLYIQERDNQNGGTEPKP